VSEAEVWARRVRRLSLNRQGTEAQVWLEKGFLYLRQDGHARFAQGKGRKGFRASPWVGAGWSSPSGTGAASGSSSASGACGSFTSRRACPPPPGDGFCR
jgi:hypothetical protein